jgi:hypothetical protein
MAVTVVSAVPVPWKSVLEEETGNWGDYSRALTLEGEQRTQEVSV